MLHSRRIQGVSFILLLISVHIAQAAIPVLYFSDLTSGPKSGNSDISQGQTAGEHGAIVTIWGVNLQNARVFCN